MVNRRHSMDILFPTVLLALYVLGAAAVAVLAGASYQRLAERSAAMSDGSAALSYVAERLHQSDEAGAVRVAELGGCPAIVITQGETSLYDTYIYCYNGSLRELMVKRELKPEPDMGRALLPMAAFTPENLGGGLLKLSCTDSEGLTRESWVALRAGEVG